MLANDNLQITCKRCGCKARYTIDNDERVGFAYYQYLGWSIRDGKYLCPDCTKRYDSLIQDFFKFIT